MLQSEPPVSFVKCSINNFGFLYLIRITYRSGVNSSWTVPGTRTKAWGRQAKTRLRAARPSRRGEGCRRMRRRRRGGAMSRAGGGHIRTTIQGTWATRSPDRRPGLLSEKSGSLSWRWFDQHDYNNTNEWYYFFKRSTHPCFILFLFLWAPWT